MKYRIALQRSEEGYSGSVVAVRDELLPDSEVREAEVASDVPRARCNVALSGCELINYSQ